MQRHDNALGVPGPRTHRLLWLITKLLLPPFLLVVGLNRTDALQKKTQHHRRLWKTSRSLVTHSQQKPCCSNYCCFLCPPTRCAKISLIVFVSDTIFHLFMLIGWRPTGSDPTLRQDDFAVSFVISKKEELSWRKKKKKRLFIKIFRQWLKWWDVWFAALGASIVIAPLCQGFCVRCARS